MNKPRGTNTHGGGKGRGMDREGMDRGGYEEGGTNEPRQVQGV